MKKLIFGGVLLFLLMGCGNSFKYSTKKEKEQFIEKMFLTDNENMQNELKKIVFDLKVKAKKDNSAKQQLEEWESVYESVPAFLLLRLIGKKVKFIDDVGAGL